MIYIDFYPRNTIISKSENRCPNLIENYLFRWFVSKFTSRDIKNGQKMTKVAQNDQKWSII